MVPKTAADVTITRRTPWVGVSELAPWVPVSSAMV